MHMVQIKSIVNEREMSTRCAEKFNTIAVWQLTLSDVCTGARLSSRVPEGVGAMLCVGEDVGLLPHSFDTVTDGLLSHASDTVAGGVVLFDDDSDITLEDFVFDDLDEASLTALDALLVTTTSVVVSQSTSSSSSSSDTDSDLADLLVATLVVPTDFSLLLIDVVLEIEVIPPVDDGLQTLPLDHELASPSRLVRPTDFAALDADDDEPLSHLLVAIPPSLDHPSSSQSPALSIPLPRIVVPILEEEEDA
jgi:hypothetical protein